MRSYRNEGFKRAAQLAGEKILKNMEGYQRVAQNIRSKPLKDVFSALSAGKLYTAFGHSVEYWERNPSFTFTEIFAELFTMETQGDSDLYFVKTLFPELWEDVYKRQLKNCIETEKNKYARSQTTRQKSGGGT